MNKHIESLVTEFPEIAALMANYKLGETALRSDGKYYPKEWTVRSNGKFYPKDWTIRSNGKFYPKDWTIRSDGNFILRTINSIQMENFDHKPAHNSTYPKGGISFSKDSFEVNQTFVFQIKFCGKSSAIRVAVKRNASCY